MRVLHIIFSMQVGGAETMLVDILNQQIKHGDTISLLIINNDYDKALLHGIDSRVNIICLNRKIASKQPFFILNLYIQLLKINPDVIHAHNHNLINLFFLSRAYKILTLHTKCLEEKIEVNNWMKYNDICAISESVRQDVLRCSNLAPALIYNGVDFNNICFDKHNEEEDKDYHIVQISRLESLKGQDILIKALSLFRERMPHIKISLDFIGEGASLEYLQHLVSDYNLGDVVNFLGKKDRSYIYQNLCNYDLLVQPSLYEGFGLTVVEAMAAKVPVLVSGIDGPMEIIRNGEFGFHFKKGDAKDCAEKIIEILRCENSNISHLIESAYLHAYENFNIERTALRYLELYKKGLKESSII